jgi:hypothetical protein
MFGFDQPHGIGHFAILDETKKKGRKIEYIQDLGVDSAEEGRYLFNGNLFEIEVRRIVNVHSSVTVIITLKRGPWPGHTERIVMFRTTLDTE